MSETKRIRTRENGFAERFYGRFQEKVQKKETGRKKGEQTEEWKMIGKKYERKKGRNNNTNNNDDDNEEEKENENDNNKINNNNNNKRHRNNNIPVTRCRPAGSRRTRVCRTGDSTQTSASMRRDEKKRTREEQEVG